MSQSSRERKLHRLYLEQTLGWAAAWLIGIAVLFTVAVTTHGRLGRQDLDAELRPFAIAIYGLTWLDDAGDFHDEVLRREPDLMDGPFDVWVIEPGERSTAHLAPGEPHFRIASLETVAAGIVESEEADFFEDGLDTRGAPYRLHGTVTYDDDDVARAAMLVAADPTVCKAAHAKFIRETALVAIVLVAAGLLVGAAMSRRALRPVLTSFEQQERFLAAAAHELRTPVASLRAVCESAGSDDRAG